MNLVMPCIFAALHHVVSYMYMQGLKSEMPYNYYPSVVFGMSEIQSVMRTRSVLEGLNQQYVPWYS